MAITQMSMSEKSTLKSFRGNQLERTTDWSEWIQKSVSSGDNLTDILFTTKKDLLCRILVQCQHMAALIWPSFACVTKAILSLVEYAKQIV